MKTDGLHAVGEHAVELDAGSDAAHVVGGADVGGNLPPVADAGVENVDFVAAEVLGVEDLDVAEAGADGAFAQAAKHEGEESADEEKAGNAAADHEQRHHRAAAIAEDVTKRKQQELAHGWRSFRESVAISMRPSVRRTMRGVCSSRR